MTTIGGLPAHILLVHAVVGLVPATALLLVLVACGRLRAGGSPGRPRGSPS